MPKHQGVYRKHGPGNNTFKDPAPILGPVTPRLLQRAFIQGETRCCPDTKRGKPVSQIFCAQDRTSLLWPPQKGSTGNELFMGARRVGRNSLRVMMEWSMTDKVIG